MKSIKIDEKKCTACRSCEVACSLTNTKEINPEMSIIRVSMKKNQYIPEVANRLDRVCNMCLACVNWCASGALTVTDVTAVNQ